MAEINVTVMKAECTEDLDEVIYKVTDEYDDLYAKEVYHKESDRLEIKIVGYGLKEETCEKLYDELSEEYEEYIVHDGDYLFNQLMRDTIIMEAIACQVEKKPWDMERVRQSAIERFGDITTVEDIDQYLKRNYKKKVA